MRFRPKKKKTHLRKIGYLCRRAKGIRFHYQLQSAPITRQWMPHFFLLHEEFRDYFCFHSQLNYKGKTWGSSQERSNKSTTWPRDCFKRKNKVGISYILG